MRSSIRSSALIVLRNSLWLMCNLIQRLVVDHLHIGGCFRQRTGGCNHGQTGCPTILWIFNGAIMMCSDGVQPADIRPASPMLSVSVPVMAI